MSHSLMNSKLNTQESLTKVESTENTKPKSDSKIFQLCDIRKSQLEAKHFEYLNRLYLKKKEYLEEYNKELLRIKVYTEKFENLFESFCDYNKERFIKSRVSLERFKSVMDNLISDTMQWWADTNTHLGGFLGDKSCNNITELEEYFLQEKHLNADHTYKIKNELNKVRHYRKAIEQELSRILSELNLESQVNFNYEVVDSNWRDFLEKLKTMKLQEVSSEEKDKIIELTTKVCEKIDEVNNELKYQFSGHRYIGQQRSLLMLSEQCEKLVEPIKNLELTIQNNEQTKSLFGDDVNMNMLEIVNKNTNESIFGKTVNIRDEKYTIDTKTFLDKLSGDNTVEDWFTEYQTKSVVEPYSFELKVLLCYGTGQELKQKADAENIRRMEEEIFGK